MSPLRKLAFEGKAYWLLSEHSLVALMRFPRLVSLDLGQMSLSLQRRYRDPRDFEFLWPHLSSIKELTTPRMYREWSGELRNYPQALIDLVAHSTSLAHLIFVFDNDVPIAEITNHLKLFVAAVPTSLSTITFDVVNFKLETQFDSHLVATFMHCLDLPTLRDLTTFRIRFFHNFTYRELGDGELLVKKLQDMGISFEINIPW